MDEMSIAEVSADRGLIGGPFGSNLIGSDYTHAGIPIIRGVNMVGRKIGGEYVYVSQEKFDNDLFRNSAEPGDLIFTQRGTLGQVALIPETPEVRYVVSQSQMRLRVNPNVAHAEYVYYATRSPEFVKQVHDNAISTGVPHINLGILSRLTMPRLPLGEQWAIAEVLGALDDKIATNGQIIAKVKDLLVAEFASLQDGDKLDLVPISELVELNPKVQSLCVEELVYLDMKNLPDQAMTVTSWSHRAPRGGARFQNGDTLLARITPCLENGKTGYVDFLADDEIGIGSTEFIVMRPRNGVPATLPYFLAIDTTFREFAIKRMVGTSGRQRLSASDIVNFQIRRPDEGGLARFSAFSDALMGRVKAAVDESRALVAARDELLPLLMSGKVRVRDAEKVVEGVV